MNNGTTSRGENNATDLHTTIGAGACITGDVRLEGDAIVLGRIEGRLEAGGELKIGREGQVAAGVACGDLNLLGSVRGDVVAGRGVELGPDSSLVGDVYSTKLTIPEGATCEGSVHIGPQAVEAGRAMIVDAAERTPIRDRMSPVSTNRLDATEIEPIGVE